MLIKELIFKSWLAKNHSQISAPDKYIKTITTLSNHLKKKDISQADLFLIDSPSESQKLKELYFENSELNEKNIKGNRMYSRAFDLYIEFLNDTYKSESITDDILNIYNQPQESETEKQNLILSRIGQGKYRKKLIEYWKCCSVTKYPEVTLLIASHIKPWNKSNNFEKLDAFNGLLLIPNIDKVFDNGLITFKNDGTIITSTLFNSPLDLGITTDMKIELNKEHKPYLEYHRDCVFRK
jgi:predicted restriction endonuclease